MGGYLARREVLTAADRRQINYASRRYSADMCISRSHPGDGHVRASLLVLRFGRPFVVFSPSASETLSAGGRSLSVTHPPLPCVLSAVWGGVSPVRSRACAQGWAPLSANTPYIYISYPFYQRMRIDAGTCPSRPSPSFTFYSVFFLSSLNSFFFETKHVGKCSTC